MQLWNFGAPYRRQLLALLTQHLLLLLGALLIVWLDHVVRVPTGLSVGLLLTLALGKGAYFLLHNFRALAAARQAASSFRRFLVLVSLNLVVIVLSYGLDYFCLYKLTPQAFRGCEPGTDWSLFGQLLYLSVTALASAVIGDISPATGPARLLLSAEILTGFVTTIFIISNFSNHVLASTHDDYGR